MSQHDSQNSNLSQDKASPASADHVDGLSGAMQGLAEHFGRLNQDGQNAWRQGLREVRSSAQSATDSTRRYVQAEPLKAVLIAAGAGAAIMVLARLLYPKRRGD